MEGFKRKIDNHELYIYHCIKAIRVEIPYGKLIWGVPVKIVDTETTSYISIQIVRIQDYTD